MTGVLELPKSEIKQTADGEMLKDTWLLGLPPEIREREGFARGTLVSLTIKDGIVQTDLIFPNPQAQESAKRFINKYGDFMREIEMIDG
ncbi:MAG: hypothetical protein H7Z37_18405 [Pyrinomonadaceae bacterium]|nr:hypothetical protein [Pyrinomonadaceae bacterium]